MQAYQDVAQALKLPGCNDSKIDPCELVFKWLNEDDSGDWLLILDNADDTDLFFRSDVSSTTETPTSRSLIDYLPRRLSPQRLLIITTRNRHLGEELVKGEICVEISPFSSQEARELLRSKLREDIDLLDTSSLERLLDVLGHIPLAITQAAAFMNRNSMSLQKYLAALEKDEQNLVDHLSEDLRDHRREPGFPNSVFRTWKLSFDQIQAQEPSTAKIFSLMAMLDRQQIPESLICNAVERDIDFTTAIGTLVGFSLVSKGINQETFAMHRLVQLSVRQWLEREDRKGHYARQALQLLAHRFPHSDYENWQMCESLLPHAQQVLNHDSTLEKDGVKRAHLLSNISLYYRQQGRYVSAYQAVSEAYNIDREQLGEVATDTLQSLSLLAIILQDQGKYEAAEEMNQRALKGYEKLHGFEHPHTLTSVNNLAAVFQAQGKYEAAEEMNQRALKGREKLLGLEHPDTLVSVNNLALVFQDQGKYEAAEEMYRRALKGYETTLGLEHPHTLNSIWSRAHLYDIQRKYDDASVLYLRASAGYLKTLGPDHPDTQRCSQAYASMINKMESENRARNSQMA